MAGIAVIFRRGVALNDVTGFMGLLVSLAALWHVLGFAFGLVYVQLSLKSLLNLVPYDRQWSMVIRTADLHLWLSGFVLILLGLLQKGALEYFSNPKLWCKITVVAVWFLSTQIMRRVGVPHLRKGKPVPMLRMSAVNISCWIYGAFLGCAKPLAYGVVSYPTFLAGFIISTILLFFILNWFVKKSGHNMFRSS
jgi:hypothetical protein